jgi:REP element-mobilizing transposase RayT
MARPLRVNFKNAWHHVMNRGAAFKNIFLSDMHREKFLTLIGEITDRYQVEIHAYCLMKNHYHLLVNTPRGNLSEAIGYLNSVYAEFFNRTQKTDGPLFRGRFKSTVIDYDDYLLRVSRYIHLNPVRAKLVEKAEEYKWSSYSAYLNLSEKKPWLLTEKVLSFLDNKDYVEQYKKVINEKDDVLDQHYKNGSWVSVLGNKDFELVIDSFRKLNPEIPNQKNINLPAIDSIKMVVAEYYNVDLSLINNSTLMKENVPRAAAIWLSRKVGKYPIAEIAYAFSNASYSSIPVAIYRMEKKCLKNIGLAKDIIFLEKKLKER